MADPGLERSSCELRLDTIVAESASLLANFLAASQTTCCLAVSTAGTVQYCNRAVDLLLEQTEPGAVGQPLARFLSAPDVLRAACEAAQPGTPTEPLLLTFRRRSGTPVSLRCHVHLHGDHLVILGEPVHDAHPDMQHLLFDLNNQLAVTARESARQMRESEQSHWRLKKIGELLPMCVECGRVEAGTAGWEDVATFFREHSRFLSHGYCPPCAARVTAEWGLE